LRNVDQDEFSQCACPSAILGSGVEVVSGGGEEEIGGVVVMMRRRRKKRWRWGWSGTGEQGW
jgi:hypothetical protein